MADTQRKLLIIDDEENMLHMLEALLSRSGYIVSSNSSSVEALRLIENNSYDFVLCDVRMPEMDGIAFLEHGAQFLSETTVIMMSAYGNIDMAISAMKAGAYDFISKPFKKDEVLLALKKAEERESLRRENRQLKEALQISDKEGAFSKIVYKAKPMEDAVNLARKAAQYDTTILITGQSGTGKELLAQGIHRQSSRKNRKFHAINCGSIPNDLLESELFGHMKGAFTGADKNKKGTFEEADGATLFLDEIGELPLNMQVKLLRVLQENEIKPVGSNISKKIDVRILAATAKDLYHEVKAGRFREDLYYRLNVLPIELPDLANRRDDIPLLCQHFIKHFNTTLKRDIEEVHPQAMDKLLRHNWPGNVRELENVIQRGIVLAEDKYIEEVHLPDSVLADKTEGSGDMFSGIESLKDAQKILEAEFIEKALEKTNGNKSSAAKILELSYPSLLNKIKEYNI